MEILRVFKNSNGEVTHILTSGGSIIEKNIALELAKEGMFEGIDVSVDQYNREVFHNFIDNTNENDFDSLISVN